MTGTPSALSAFANALLDRGGPVPAGVIARLEPDIESRFDVYRNNVFASLIDALKDSFPVIEKLLGNEFFRALAAEFIALSPPDSPVLLEYGAGFAAFVSGFEPLKDMPWLADIARLEMAWLGAYHASDAKALGTEDFAEIAPAQISQIRLTMHPSAQLVRSSWPVGAIWQANQESAPESEIDLDQGGEDVLILRPDEEVELHILPAGTGAFITALQNNEPLQTAHLAALSRNAGFDLSTALAHLITSGAFSQISR